RPVLFAVDGHVLLLHLGDQRLSVRMFVIDWHDPHRTTLDLLVTPLSSDFPAAHHRTPPGLLGRARELPSRCQQKSSLHTPPALRRRRPRRGQHQGTKKAGPVSRSRSSSHEAQGTDRPGGADSSQDKKPVSASLPMASSSCGPWPARFTTVAPAGIT